MHAIVVPRRRSNPPPFLLAIAAARLQGETISVEAEQLVVELFQAEGRSLVRLARLFVDDFGLLVVEYRDHKFMILN